MLREAEAPDDMEAPAAGMAVAAVGKRLSLFGWPRRPSQALPPIEAASDNPLYDDEVHEPAAEASITSCWSRFDNPSLE